MSTELDTAGASAAGTRPRGRPRQFDGDAVLDQVVQLFWDQGFEFTSVADIVDATGLNKSSLYNAFGSKEALFAAALDRYLTERTGMITDTLLNGHAGLADIETLLDLMSDEAGSDTGRRGCLAVNTATELGLRDEAVVRLSRDFRDQIRAALRAALARAEAAGEIAAGTADDRAAILLSFVLSLSVMARSGADDRELEVQFGAIRALLADWRR